MVARAALLLLLLLTDLFYRYSVNGFLFEVLLNPSKKKKKPRRKDKQNQERERERDRQRGRKCVWRPHIHYPLRVAQLHRSLRLLLPSVCVSVYICVFTAVPRHCARHRSPFSIRLCLRFFPVSPSCRPHHFPFSARKKQHGPSANARVETVRLTTRRRCLVVETLFAIAITAMTAMRRRRPGRGCWNYSQGKPLCMTIDSPKTSTAMIDG